VLTDAGAARVASIEARTNLILFAFDIVFVTPALLAITGLFIRWNSLVLLQPAQWSALPVLLIAVIAVFAGDFIGYWRHRLEHTNALWPGHAIHHGDTAMTWTTGLRFHPLTIGDIRHFRRMSLSIPTPVRTGCSRSYP
jgi:sterol desaturase/sphingolipid hydroxylase (fatty acid hydroxylase superfamily)